MNKLLVPLIVVAAGMSAPAAWAQTPEPPRFQPKAYFEMPLEKDATRQVRLQSITIPAHEGNNFHRHPGDQWSAVQEGEVTLTVQGQAPRTLKVGDSAYIPRGTIHRNENKSNAPTRTIELLIMDKGKPQNNQVAE